MKLKFFLLFLLSLYIVNCTFYIEAQATTRYVSKTGTSQFPYTSWQTAADSIQKCINICVDGDTVYVANGIYHESLIVNKYLWLIGSSMDSTVIDGTGLANFTVDFQSDGYIQNFYIIGKGEGTLSTVCIWSNLTNAIIENCRIMSAYYGVGIVWSSSRINRCIITNVTSGFGSGCAVDTCNPIIENSIILINSSLDGYGIRIEGGGNSSFNNIVLVNENSASKGIGVVFNSTTNIIKNNLVSGFRRNIDGLSSDTAIVHNNISVNGIARGITINALTGMRSNIIAKNEIGLVYPTVTSSDYNLYWQNNANTTDQLAQHDIVADPMFVNDTIPVYGGSYDYHLQKYSPAIDAGDPNILDVDGSRSDIGMFGGPLGQVYTYLDLAPKPPRNLTASMDSGLVQLKWNKNTEADLFRYRVYRDTVPDFVYDTTKIIAVLSDTIFYDDPPQKFISGNYYYKITAIDSAYHQSPASEEAHINITGIPEAPPIVVEHYNLLQNYPNPFNPSTTIPYRLKAPGYVKVMVYNLLGEQVKVLVNKYQSAGYYEVLFHPTATERQSAEGKIEFETGYGDIVSGIYLYRIEVIGEGNIPVFTDMKKMMLVK